MALSIVILMLAVSALAQTGARQDAAATLPLDRTVSGQTLASAARPARIEFNQGYKYLGGQRFILYNVADAEQHLFADADQQNRIRRLYWLQFEGYLPNNTRSSYNYKSTRTTNIGGLEFIVDTWVRKYTEPSQPGTDGARMRELLESKRFRLPDEAAAIRLVHLTDTSKRNELMIIYMEDLTGSGFRADELAPGGAHADRWPAMGEELLRRATAGIKITQ